jgi:hypothetical protein
VGGGSFKLGTERARSELFAQLRARAGKNSDLRLTLQPVIDVLAHLILGQAIALLDEALKLLALSADHGQIVIGELPQMPDIPITASVMKSVSMTYLPRDVY